MYRLRCTYVCMYVWACMRRSAFIGGAGGCMMMIMMYVQTEMYVCRCRG